MEQRLIQWQLRQTAEPHKTAGVSRPGGTKPCRREQTEPSQQ